MLVVSYILISNSELGLYLSLLNFKESEISTQMDSNTDKKNTFISEIL